MIEVGLHPQAHFLLKIELAHENAASQKHFLCTHVANFKESQAEVDHLLYGLSEALTDHNIHVIIRRCQVLTAACVHWQLHQKLSMLSSHKEAIKITSLNKILQDIQA